MVEYQLDSPLSLNHQVINYPIVLSLTPRLYNKTSPQDSIPRTLYQDSIPRTLYQDSIPRTLYQGLYTKTLYQGLYTKASTPRTL